MGGVKPKQAWRHTENNMHGKQSTVSTPSSPKTDRRDENSTHARTTDTCPPPSGMAHESQPPTCRRKGWGGWRKDKADMEAHREQHA